MASIRSLYRKLLVSLLCVGFVFQQPLHQALATASSASYQLQGSVQHSASLSSSSYSACTEFGAVGRYSDSTSYSQRAYLNCLQNVVVQEEDEADRRRRRQCGNSIVEPWEQCDDGNQSSYDGCSDQCLIEVCGDGVLQTNIGEQCDDGNVTNGDGCNLSCQIEVVTPPGPPTPPTPPTTEPEPEPETPVVPVTPVQPVCGNFVVESGETCDDGNTFSGDGCNAFCRRELTPAIPVDYIAICGNAVLEFGEQCDDGNLTAGDGCSAYCTEEPLRPAAPEPEVIPEVQPGEPSVLPREPVQPVPGTEPLQQILEREPGEGALIPGLMYLTDDETVLFSERFAGGSGDYHIFLQDLTRSYEVRSIPSSPDFFSVQVEEELGDGIYQVTVRDRQNPQRLRVFFLEVRHDANIPVPIWEHLDGLVGMVPQQALLSVLILSEDRVEVVPTKGDGSFDLSRLSDQSVQVVAQYENGHVSRELAYVPIRLHAAAGQEPCCGWFFVLLAFMMTLLTFGLTRDGSSRSSRKIAALLVVAVLSGSQVWSSPSVFAVTTTPNIIPYEGVLRDAGGTPITVAQDFRFSIWLDSDFTAGVDRDGAGAIPGAAPGYSGFSEVQTVTPDGVGYFQINIGEVAGTIPDFTITSDLYLQVEVKPSGSPNTAYETLDIDGIDNLVDRQAIGTLPYARNADFIDNREIGTSDGDIAILGPGDVFDTSVIPGGTNSDDFLIDANDDAPGITRLSFGGLLQNRILSYDPDGVALGDGWFDFSDDVNIQGDLTVTGTVNGVPVGQLNKSLSFQPEYMSYALDADGSDNRGKMEVFFIDTDGAAAPDNFNYYRWTTKNPALQDLDIVVRVRLPDDFLSFQATPIVFRYRTSDNVLASNRVDVSVEDSTGTLVPGLAGNTGLTSAGVFATTNITFGGGTFTAGSEITLRIKLSALSTNFADASDFTLNYVGY